MVLIRSARRWWTQSNPQALIEAQDKLLTALVQSPFVRTSAAGLNSVEFSKTNSDTSSTTAANQTVILAHGFGSGLAFFYQNVDALLQHPSVRRVILVDWLGMGGSDRPQCHARPIRGWSDYTTSWCDSRYTPSQAVQFFVDPFHEWMQTAVLGGDHQDNNAGSKVVLVGHSLGGYLSARYILQHPTTVHRLVLASPVGFPKKPDVLLKGSQLPTSLRIVDALWSSNLTPQQLVRLMGASRGRQNTRRALRGRIPQLLLQNSNSRGSGSSSGEMDLDLLADYLYHITVADPSGEFAMNSLLEPVISPDVRGVFAREPLEEHFPALEQQHSSSVVQQIKVLYGDHDWMRPNEPSARKVLERLRQQTGMDVSVDIVPNAGHHLYLDNSVDFVRHILKH